LKEFLRCSAAISDRGVSEGCKIEDGEVDRREEGRRREEAGLDDRQSCRDVEIIV
jgi:hypothetical protein